MTAHHNEDGFTIDLVERDLHGNIPHQGAASLLRKWSEPWRPIAIRDAGHIAAGGRVLGYVGMAYGAYVDGKSLYDQYQISKKTGDYSNTYWEGARIGAAWGTAAVMGEDGALIGAELGLVGGPVGVAVGGLIGGAIMGGIGYWIGSQTVTQSVPARPSMPGANLGPVTTTLLVR